MWYFLCPHTGKRCRKLFSIGKKFLHREAYTGCMYESQTYSPKTRKLLKLYEKAFGSDKLYEQLYSKHFGIHLQASQQKRYLKLMKKVQESEWFAYWEKELLLMA